MTQMSVYFMRYVAM